MSSAAQAHGPAPLAGAPLGTTLRSLFESRFRMGQRLSVGEAIGVFVPVCLDAKARHERGESSTSIPRASSRAPRRPPHRALARRRSHLSARSRVHGPRAWPNARARRQPRQRLRHRCDALRGAHGSNGGHGHGAASRDRAFRSPRRSRRCSPRPSWPIRLIGPTTWAPSRARSTASRPQPEPPAAPRGRLAARQGR